MKSDEWETRGKIAVSEESSNLDNFSQEPTNILESISDAFFALDHNWKFVYLNTQAEKLLLKSSRQLLGQSIWQEFPEAVGSNFEVNYRKAVETGQSVFFEEFYPPLNGWFEVRAYPTPQGLVVYFNNVNERKQTQQALLEEQQKLSTILEATTEGIYGVDRNGVCTFINRAALELLGYSEAECLGQPIDELIHTGQPAYAPAQSPLRRTLCSGQPARLLEETLYQKDGAALPVFYSCSPTLQEGVITGAVVTIVDLRERKQTEAALQETEARFKFIWESASDAVALSDATGKVLAANPAYFELYGYQSQEVIGQDFAVIFPPQLREQARQHYKDTFTSEKRISIVEAIIQRADGSQRMVESSYDFITHDGVRTLMVSVVRDVTVRKQQEQAQEQLLRQLELEQARLQTIIQNLPAGVLLATAPHGQIIMGNPQVEQILRHPVLYSSEVDRYGEWVGYHPDGRLVQGHEWPLALALKGEFVRGNEYLYQRGDGTKGWIKISSAPIFNSSGEITGSVIVFYDIDDEKRLQQQLDFQATVLSQLYDSVIAIDNEERVTSWNKGAERLYGWTAEEVMGQPVQEINHYQWLNPEDEQEAYTALQERGLWQGQNIHYDREGRAIWVESSVSLLKDDQSQPVGMLSVTRNITARKQAEDRLKFLAEISQALASSLDSETNFEEIGRLSLDYFTDYFVLDLIEESDDLASLRRLVTIHRDPAKQALAKVIDNQYPPLKEGPHPLAQVLSNPTSLLITEMTDEMLQAQARSPEHLRLLREFQPKSVISVPLVARSKTIGILSFISAEGGRHYGPDDLNFAEEVGRRIATALDNSQLYNEMQKSLAALKELDYLKDVFVSLTSHELRTPLTSIKGYAQLLQRNLVKQNTSNPPGENQAKQLRQMDNILYQTNRMNDMINQLLDFSRIQNQKLELNLKPEVDLLNLVGRVVEQQAMNNKDHRLIFQAAETQALATIDAARLEQVLDNLIGNAIKYSPAQTTVTVGLEMTETGQTSDSEVVIWVRDEGAGISEKDQAHIFDRFYRVRSQETSRVEGLGLGLYISYQIVKQHNGRMWLQSQPGHGSTFYVALPAKNSKQLAV